MRNGSKAKRAVIGDQLDRGRTDVHLQVVDKPKHIDDLAEPANVAGQAVAGRWAKAIVDTGWIGERWHRRHGAATR